MLNSYSSIIRLLCSGAGDGLLARYATEPAFLPEPTWLPLNRILPQGSGVERCSSQGILASKFLDPHWPFYQKSPLLTTVLASKWASSTPTTLHSVITSTLRHAQIPLTLTHMVLFYRSGKKRSSGFLVFTRLHYVI